MHRTPRGSVGENFFAVDPTSLAKDSVHSAA